MEGIYGYTLRKAGLDWFFNLFFLHIELSGVRKVFWFWFFLIPLVVQFQFYNYALHHIIACWIGLAGPTRKNQAKFWSCLAMELDQMRTQPRTLFLFLFFLNYFMGNWLGSLQWTSNIYGTSYNRPIAIHQHPLS